MDTFMGRHPKAIESTSTILIAWTILENKQTNKKLYP